MRETIPHNVVISFDSLNRTVELDGIKVLNKLIIASNDSEQIKLMDALLEVAPFGTNFEYIRWLGIAKHVFSNCIFKNSRTPLKEMINFKYTNQEYKVILTHRQMFIYNKIFNSQKDFL